MCGIIGYTGEKEAEDILVDGLEILEYRGYDSAGIALCQADGSVRISKCAGRVKELRAVQFYALFFQYRHMEFRQHKIFFRILSERRHIGSEHASLLYPSNHDRAHIAHCKNSPRNILEYNTQGKSSF